MRPAVVVGVVAALVALVAVAAVVRALASRKPPEGADVAVVVEDPGLSAAESESALATPIEGALASVEGVARLRSESSPGRAVVTCTLDAGKERFVALQAVRAALAATLRQLPPEVAAPDILLRGAGEPLWALGDPEAARTLSTGPGVAESLPCGAVERRLTVTLSPPALAAYGLEVDAIVASLRRRWTTNEVAPAANTFGATEIAVRDGVAVHLADVAKIASAAESTGCEAVGATDVIRIGFAETPRSDVAPAVVRMLATLDARLLDPKTVIVFAVDVDATQRKERMTAVVAAVKTLPGVVTAFAVRRVEADTVEAVVQIDPKQTRENPDIARAVALPGVAWRGLRASPFGVPTTMTVTVLGPDLAALAARAAAVRKTVEAVEGVGAYVGASARSTTAVEAEIDRDRAATLGIPVSAIARAVRLGMGGLAVTGQVSLVVDRPAGGGDLVPALTIHGAPLASVVRLKTTAALGPIVHVDRQRAIELRWETARPSAKQGVARALGVAPDLRVD